MIKNLRKKFTVVAMCSMFVVLVAIMAAFHVLNYVHSVDNIDRKLHMIAQNNGKFPSPPSPKDEPEKREEPYQTRYFSVRIDKKGKVAASDLHNIVAVSEEEAKRYAKKVYAGQKKKGFYGIYRYMSVKENGDTLVIFLDSSQELASFRANLVTSVTVSFVGLLAVFVLVFIFSRIVFRPVAEAYINQKRFITDASHEIKTPLAIIDANVEVIEMELGADEWTKSIRRQVRRLVHLTQQLVTLTKLDEEGTSRQKSEFSLTDAVWESIQPFEVFAKTSGKAVETNIEEQIAMVGEEKSIRQMIGILMDNAVKYSLPESVICVSLAKNGKRVRFEVYNETETVPQGNLDVLFERFYRLDASRNSETGGSGIGLSVANAIVASHHGKIKAQSDDGKSVRITVEFH